MYTKVVWTYDHIRVVLLCYFKKLIYNFYHTQWVITEKNIYSQRVKE